MGEKTGEKLDLLDVMDDAARALLKDANGHTIEAAGDGSEPQPIDLKGRVAAFAAVTDWIVVKHKIRPEGAKASGIDGYRKRISGTPGSRARGGTDKTGSSDGEADS